MGGGRLGVELNSVLVCMGDMGALYRKIGQYQETPMNYLFIGSILATLYFGLGHRALILFTLFVPLLFVRMPLREIPRSHWIFIALLAQYAVLHFVKLAFFDPHYELGNDHPPSELQHWIWGFVLAVLVPWRLMSITNVREIFERLAPWVLVSVFIAMSVRYYWPETPVCRMVNFHMPVFTAPMVFSTLTLMLFYDFKEKSRFLQMIAFACIGFSIFISTAFALTRGIFMVQIFTYLLLFFVLIVMSKKYWSMAFGIICSMLIALVLVIFVEGVDRCNFTKRLLFIGKAFQKNSELVLPEAAVSKSNIQPLVNVNAGTEINDGAVTASIEKRILFYKLSIEKIHEAPFLGHGVAYEQQIIPRKYAEQHIHVHNMYLSWLIWGGIISLFSGLIFIFSSAFEGKNIKEPNKLITCGATIGILGLPMLVDSFMVWRHYYYIYLLLLSMCYFLTFVNPDMKHMLNKCQD